MVIKRIKDGIPLLNEKTYKILTVMTMLICHICMLLFVPLITSGPVINITWYQIIFWYTKIMYFPMPFIFMIPVEAFFHTRSRIKYLTGMFIMALISEIPFDLATLGGSIESVHTEKISSPLEYLAANKEIIIKNQNILFSISLGFGAVWIIDRLKMEIRGVFQSETASKVISLLSTACVSYIAGYTGYILNLDHKWWLPVTMILLYLFHDNRFLMCFIPTLFLMLNGTLILKSDIFISCAAGGLLMFFYSGERGHISKGFKRFFYWFYPVHFFILYCLQVLIFK